MSAEPSRGAPEVYEVVWKSGHVERIPAHQVTYPGNADAIFGGRSREPRVHPHAELNGRWLLTLDALQDDIRSMRLVTDGEPIPGSGEATA